MELKLLNILDEDYLWEMGYERNVDYEIQLDDIEDFENPSIIICMKDKDNKFTCRLYLSENFQIYIEEGDLYTHLYTDLTILKNDLKWSEYSYGKEYNSPTLNEKLPINNLFFISKRYYRKLYPKGGKIVNRINQYYQLQTSGYSGWKLNGCLKNEADEYYMKQYGYEVTKDANGRYFLKENGRDIELIRYLTAYYKFDKKITRDLYPDINVGDDILYEYSRREYCKLFDILYDMPDGTDENEFLELNFDHMCVDPYPFPSMEEMLKYRGLM